MDTLAGVETDIFSGTRQAVPNRVYLIDDGEQIKIGVSSNPWQRHKQIKRGTLVGAIYGNRTVERLIHTMLSECAIEGQNEWFHRCSETERLIAFFAKHPVFDPNRPADDPESVDF